VLVWLICLIAGWAGWVVNFAFSITIISIAVIWIARNIIFRSLTTEGKLNTTGIARHAAFITTCALYTLVVLWLLPIYPTSSGPSWSELVLCLIVVATWFFAARKNHRVGGYKVQLGFGMKDAAMLELPTDDRSRLDAFEPSVLATYIAAGFSLFVFVYSCFEDTPHGNVVLFSLVISIIAMAVIGCAKWLAAKAVKFDRNFAKSVD
jgi:hypothetical protein